MIRTSAREIEMTYTATAATITQSIAAESFTSLRAAKAYARKTVGDGVDVVIIDDEFPTRHIKAFLRKGEINWGGDCPPAWYRA
jgi:hypothetical protein